eukprot:TRINITY_DN13540_c0_g1_i1.p1 TRINITY_DN13540_c0_g1~~TRINITY_DN13540_c0_g1_i1.p1  ORF type:complete len:667 (+),score=176.20 TRINITY_DN13540_c0_g1_i1:64-2001(+)
MVQVKKKKVDKSHPFQKKKQKVGKKKLKPVAATNAEIHSKAIFMKKQTKQETEEYVNERKLTYADSVAKLKHFNNSVKKEGLLALHGMVKVTLEGTAIAIPPSSHASLLQSSLPLLVDSDLEVRKAVAALVKITASLLDHYGTLKAMLPLLIRYITVALTHMESSVRNTACKSLHYICLLGVSPLPDGLTLLDCTFRMLRSAERPRDRSQPPVMQAYISILRSSLCSVAVAEHQFLKSTSTTDELGVVLSTERGVANYLVKQGMDIVLPHWVESFQDNGRDTKAGPWELGLLDILNMLFTSLAVKQGPKQAGLTKRYAQLARSFKQSVGKIAGMFPLNTTTSDGHRVNTQLALLITFFLPLNAEPVHKWLATFLKNNAARTLRPEDIQALCVVVERINKYAPNEVEEGMTNVSLTSLLRVCGTPGSLSQLEILRAIRRMTDDSLCRTKPFSQGFEDCVPLVPGVLYELMNKMKHASKETQENAAGEIMVPTVDGGVMVERAWGVDLHQQAAYELLSLMLRYSSVSDISDQCKAELRLALFASNVENTWHLGLLRYLPPQLAYMSLSFLSILAEDNEAILLTSLLEDLDLTTPFSTDPLLAYALTLMQPYDMSECYEELEKVQTLEGFPQSKQAADDILAEYAVEE